MRLLRALHIEGLPATVSAADLSTLMAPYGNVQYAEVSLCMGNVCSVLPTNCHASGDGRTRFLTQQHC